MSGGIVFRCQFESGRQAALKRLPIDTRRDRIKEIHKVIRHAEAGGNSLVPKIFSTPGGDPSETVWGDRQGLWELQQWMTGNPCDQTDLNETALTQITNGAAAIAQFHASVQALGTHQMPAPAVMARLKRTRDLNRLLPDAFAMTSLRGSTTEKDEANQDLALAIDDASRLLKWKWNEVQSQIIRSLGQYVERAVDVQYVLRDVHRGHVLFEGEKPSALIDFDAVRLDTTMADLARWTGSFASLKGAETSRGKNSLWNAALAGFFNKNPLKSHPEHESDARMAKDLCYATTWISLGNWLVWIVCQKRTFPCGAKMVATRIRELLRMTVTTKDV